MAIFPPLSPKLMLATLSRDYNDPAGMSDPFHPALGKWMSRAKLSKAAVEHPGSERPLGADTYLLVATGGMYVPTAVRKSFLAWLQISLICIRSVFRRAGRDLVGYTHAH